MGLKTCPSCGSGIEQTAVLCPLCGTEFGSKGTSVRAPASAEAGPEPEKIAIEADPLPLLPILLLRMLLAAAFVGAVVLAIAASPLGPVTKFVQEHRVGPRSGAVVLWGAAAGFLGLVVFTGTLVRRFRLRHTLLFGTPVKVGLGLGPLIVNLLIALFLGPLTAGVALPWLHVRFRQSFYRACIVPSRGDRPLGFQGRGEEVLGRAALSLLLLPLGIASGGLLLGLVSWIWVKWEQSDVVVPDRSGRYLTVDFFGSFWAYQLRWIWGWLLSVLTLGIYRPWAKVSEWRWIAKYTHLP